MSKPSRRPTREARKEHKQGGVKRNGNCALREPKRAWCRPVLRASRTAYAPTGQTLKNRRRGKRL